MSNIFKSIKVREIFSNMLSIYFLVSYHRVKFQISKFTTFGGHLEFFAENGKMANISETVRERAISSKFWTRSVVEGYSVET